MLLEYSFDFWSLKSWDMCSEMWWHETWKMIHCLVKYNVFASVNCLKNNLIIRKKTKQSLKLIICQWFFDFWLLSTHRSIMSFLHFGKVFLCTEYSDAWQHIENMILTKYFLHDRPTHLHCILAHFGFFYTTRPRQISNFMNHIILHSSNW